MIKLTNREQEILTLIFLNNKEIANKLVISQASVKTHIHNMLKKYNAKSRTELVYKVMEDRNMALSVNEINFLQSQNEGLKEQNKTLQKAVMGYATQINQIYKLCKEPADSMAVVSLQDKIMAVINEQA